MAKTPSRADTRAMKRSLTAIAVLLLITGCPKQSPPPATSTSLPGR